MYSLIFQPTGCFYKELIEVPDFFKIVGSFNFNMSKSAKNITPDLWYEMIVLKN